MKKVYFTWETYSSACIEVPDNFTEDETEKMLETYIKENDEGGELYEWVYSKN